MGRVIKIWFSNDFSLSSKVGETRRLAILLVGHGGAHYQASSRGFFPLAAVTIFAEHLNGILYRLSLSLSLSVVVTLLAPIPCAHDRKVRAIITVVIARAYTRHLTPQWGGSAGVESTGYRI